MHSGLRARGLRLLLRRRVLVGDVEALVTALRVLLLMLSMLPVRGDGDVLHRWRLAEAIATATDDVREQDLLVGVARWESFFRVDVATCKRKGSAGEVTAWQIRRKRGDDLCRTYEADAKVALGRIRESLAECAAYPEETRLASYATGNCASKTGQRLSRMRWVDSTRAKVLP